ncbi:MAG: hypothetical protein JXA82_06575 [Sedimentisphaerales bacterium]|nr:hypothetical protein [Sedimentisphaerales bacterium]
MLCPGSPLDGSEITGRSLAATNSTIHNQIIKVPIVARSARPIVPIQCTIPFFTYTASKESAIKSAPSKIRKTSNIFHMSNTRYFRR